MKLNLGFFINKFFSLINRPALRDCNIDKTAKICSATNCIQVSMGQYSYVGKNCSIHNVNIGAYTSISSNCSIGGGEHDYTMVSTSPVFHEGRNILKKNFSDFPLETMETVNIGNDVWIGEFAFIKAGKTIGDGAIIGAHSIVTHDVPPYAIVAGCPAKIISYRFDKDTIEFLQELNWWDKSDDEIKKLSKHFDDPKKLKDYIMEK